MEKILNLTALTLLVLTLGGCLASTTSPDGLNCDFSTQKPLWEMPSACVGNG